MTNIEWTDATWNPVRGCTRVSEGCRNCYAERQAIRQAGAGKAYEGLVQITNGHPQWTGKVVCDQGKLEDPLHWKKPRMVFVNSMSDLFHEDLPDVFILQVLAIIAGSPRHTYQVLTKRADRMQSFFSQFKSGGDASEMIGFGCREGGAIPNDWMFDEDFECYVSNSISGQLGKYGVGWPLKNLWLGVSVEDQQRADERIPLLLQTPAAVRFLSVEPMLGPVNINAYLSAQRGKHDGFQGVDWVIVGGESGPGARPFNLAWAESIVAQCKATGVPCFVKQIGSKPFLHREGSIERDIPGGHFRIAHLEIESSVRVRDRKGGDPAEWPESIRIREFPHV